MEELQKDIGTLLAEYACNPEDYSLVETVKDILGFVEKHLHLKLIWYILDEIAVKASASNRSDLSDKAVEAMRLISSMKPSPEECRELYLKRKGNL